LWVQASMIDFNFDYLLLGINHHVQDNLTGVSRAASSTS
jgi:hypothetical protein